MLTQTKPTSGNGFTFLYGPGDERIWAIDWTQGTAPSNWRETWTLRDLDGSPLRQFQVTGGNTSTANYALRRDYVYRGGLLAAHTPQGRRHYHLDHLGSPRMITDASGTTLAQHLYFPFGEEATNPGQNDEVLRFTAHERDFLDPTGTTRELDYMHARYFSAHLGRFQSVDRLSGVLELPQSWNRFGYVLGNPVNYIDPTGEFAWTAGQAQWDFLFCLMHGGCANAVIDVVAEAPRFDPLTGVSGLSDLLEGSAFLLGLSGTMQGGPGGAGEFKLSFGERVLSAVLSGFAQTTGEAIVGFGDTLSFGLTGRYRTHAGLANTIDEDSGAYLTGQVAGVAHGVALGGVGAARVAGVQTKLAIHGAHHTFPRLGGRRLAHIQLNVWRTGVKGSGKAFRIALPWR